MKGYELIKAIAENKIKDNTRIKVKDEMIETEIKYKDGRLEWKPEKFDTTFLCDAITEFEVIEELKELENEIIVDDWQRYATMHHNKINELVREINKIKERK